MAILDQFEVYIQIRYIVFIVVLLASFSNNILLTFLVTTLLVGLINWFVSEDAFRYSQELMNIATNLKIDIDTRSKRILSKIRARSLFASISYTISIIVSSFILEKTPIHKFIIDFAIAYKFVGKENLKLTSDGTNLSGGDKQKIVLGRLISNCKDMDVIILDEVTSSMDTDTETKAFDEILPLLKNKIVLIISHNRNLQRYANRIVKLKDKTIMLENN